MAEGVDVAVVGLQFKAEQIGKCACAHVRAHTHTFTKILFMHSNDDGDDEEPSGDYTPTDSRYFIF